jgi:hypothetical protein
MTAKTLPQIVKKGDRPPKGSIRPRPTTELFVCLSPLPFRTCRRNGVRYRATSSQSSDVFCGKRGITFIDVDLRWGVTREEAERGDVLDICLREIDRCRPWVLGMLGARYGWVDSGARDRLTAEPRFSRLVVHVNVSVTELELRHAITDRPPVTPVPAVLLYWQVAPTRAKVIDFIESGNLDSGVMRSASGDTVPALFLNSSRSARVGD